MLAEACGDGGSLPSYVKPCESSGARQESAGKQIAGTEKAAAKPKPPQVAVGVSPKRYNSGDTIKDCQECPEMVVIPAGGFVMGSPEDEKQRLATEGPQHGVKIAAPFAVGKYEVTQDEWQAVMGSKPSNFKGGRNPVEMVSWEDAQAFVRKLSEKTDKQYRLLSESEWEYVARAGTTSPFYTGDRITTKQANFDGNYTYNGSSKGEYRKRTVKVGSFPANRFGVHDMHGNVWEWVEDCWHSSYGGAPTDGSAWESKNKGDCTRRVLRGGSWLNNPRDLRSAFRHWFNTTYRSNRVGFRIASTPLGQSR